MYKSVQKYLFSDAEIDRPENPNQKKPKIDEVGAISSNHKRQYIGIDLGTTYSRVAFVKNGRVEVISNDRGEKGILSRVTFVEGDELFVGDNEMRMYPKSTVSGAKKTDWTES
eukprot:TRINITY_DN8050_c0_g1_i1.p1 TRINITY_DN8050_c0_g1~~TRINITY_DN8050_c0_g1_i1.p1  ORF type:complete len:113 (+),score=22.87 TRINITY_DN8050_c0_g1_i1:80-418(+)